MFQQINNNKMQGELDFLQDNFKTSKFVKDSVCLYKACCTPSTFPQDQIKSHVYAVIKTAIIFKNKNVIKNLNEQGYALELIETMMPADV